MSLLPARFAHDPEVAAHAGLGLPLRLQPKPAAPPVRKPDDFRDLPYEIDEETGEPLPRIVWDLAVDEGSPNRDASPLALREIDRSSYYGEFIEPRKPAGGVHDDLERMLNRAARDLADRVCNPPRVVGSESWIATNLQTEASGLSMLMQAAQVHVQGLTAATDQEVRAYYKDLKLGKVNVDEMETMERRIRLRQREVQRRCIV